MNIDQLREDLKVDEGVKYEIYLDHLGLPTFGIGHLVTESDPEHGQPVGTTVSEDRVNKQFEADVQLVLQDCVTVFPNFDTLPETAQLVIANMMFNMGRPRFSGFKKFIAGVNANDWMEAGRQMEDSRWYRQVTNRAKRLKARIETLATVSYTHLTLPTTPYV